MSFRNNITNSLINMCIFSKQVSLNNSINVYVSINQQKEHLLIEGVYIQLWINKASRITLNLVIASNLCILASK